VYGREEDHCEKRCEIQGGGQEMAVMVGYWQHKQLYVVYVKETLYQLSYFNLMCHDLAKFFHNRPYYTQTFEGIKARPYHKALYRIIIY